MVVEHLEQLVEHMMDGGGGAHGGGGEHGGG